MEHYLTEGGVLYFVVYSKDVSPTVTYASLTPKVIKNVLPASDKKKRIKKKEDIFLLFWMAIIAKLLILPYPALQTSYKSRPCLRRSSLRKLTQIPFSIVTKVGNTNMKSITAFLQVKAYILPCLAKGPARIMVWWNPSLVSWRKRCFMALRRLSSLWINWSKLSPSIFFTTTINALKKN